MAAPTARYCDYGSGTDGAPGDGSSAHPYKTIQYTLDHITRDSTNGDQINVKAGTAQVLAASLTLATYGTPTSAAPLVIRGYTTTVGDGGQAAVDCNGAPFWLAGNAYSRWVLADLQIYNFGDNNGIVGTNTAAAVIWHCEVHKGVSSPSGKYLIDIGNGIVIGCYVHDAGTTGMGIRATSAAGRAVGNYVYNCPTGIGAANVIGNIIVDCAAAIAPNTTGTQALVWGNSVYSSTANTGSAINMATTNQSESVVANNIVEGYSGVGGKAVTWSTADVALMGYNAYYNNTANESLGDLLINAGGSQTLAASPFVDPTHGNFAVGTNVKALGWPASWYGPSATTNYQDIGAVQRKEAGGAVSISPAAGRWV